MPCYSPDQPGDHLNHPEVRPILDCQTMLLCHVMRNYVDAEKLAADTTIEGVALREWWRAHEEFDAARRALEGG